MIRDKQKMIKESKADIVFVGGLGNGKTHSIINTPSYMFDCPEFEGLLVRRMYKHVNGSGGIKDRFLRTYPNTVCRDLCFTDKLPSGGGMQYLSLERESSVWDVAGCQFTYIGIEEAQQIRFRDFEYLMSRCRSDSKYKSRMVVTTQTVKDSWVYPLIEPFWLDLYGYPMEAACGVLRWLACVDGQWNSFGSLAKAEEVYEMPISYTYIGLDVRDNLQWHIDNPKYKYYIDELGGDIAERFYYGRWV